MKRNQWPLLAMLVALMAVLSLSGTATASTPGTNSGTGTERSPDPDDSDCDVYLGDIKSPDKIFPGDERFNPVMNGEQAQLWQYHTTNEDTFGVMFLWPWQDTQISDIYIHDKNSGQYCWSERSTVGDNGLIKLETGVLNNLSTSIELCIVPRVGPNVRCSSEWYREDAGGHRQVGRNGLRANGILDKDPQENLGSMLAHDYNENRNDHFIRPGKGVYVHHSPAISTSVEMNYDAFNWFWAQETYAVMESDSSEQMVSVQSDKYGQGNWYKGKWKDGKYRAETGIYYNEEDRLRVCTKNEDELNSQAKCGDWNMGHS